jgi:hypothetical protein
VHWKQRNIEYEYGLGTVGRDVLGARRLEGVAARLGDEVGESKARQWHAGVTSHPGPGSRRVCVSRLHACSAGSPGSGPRCLCRGQPFTSLVRCHAPWLAAS